MERSISFVEETPRRIVPARAYDVSIPFIDLRSFGLKNIKSTKNAGVGVLNIGTVFDSRMLLEAVHQDCYSSFISA